MNLNTNIVNGSKSIIQQQMIDPVSQVSPLPIDVRR